MFLHTGFTSSCDRHPTGLHQSVRRMLAASIYSDRTNAASASRCARVIAR
jgi:hypothetical protein